MRKAVFVFALSLFLILSIGVLTGFESGADENTTEAMQGPCEWNTGDEHKMHYPQLPDESGWDVNATLPMVLADDWECSETGWVKDLHFWGSWKDGITGNILAFRIAFYGDIPADPPQLPYSRPGMLLWEREITDFTAIAIDPGTFEGWYDPATGETLWGNHTEYFKYDVCFEEPWFFQDSGLIYWVSITAVVEDAQGTQWGWKSTQDHFNDDAVWAFEGEYDWIDIWEPAEPLVNDFFIAIDPMGMFVGGGGAGAYGAGWYFYPEEDWWNIWFYDHPFDSARMKTGFIEFDVFPMDQAMPGYFEIAVNWSTDLWSIEQPPGDSTPPLPGVPELPYIGRLILFAGEYYEGHYRFEYEIPDYNPEWVSVDVRGYNFNIPAGLIEHTCMGSLDLAFVITAEGSGEEPEACCFPNGTCTDMMPANCIAAGGTPQGPGIFCSAAQEACCLTDGSCVMADPICCDDLGGTPQGPGTSCSQFEACCMPNGSCRDLDPLCCVDQGGTPQGAGSACTGVTVACCFADGSCMTVEALCCDDLGGTASPWGYSSCQGDGDLNGTDDACEPPQTDGACCLPDGSCTVTSLANCASLNGSFKGLGTTCFGDNNGNGIDDACESPWNPEDGHKMHYPQLPDEAGWDVYDVYPFMLADDWMCSETGPVKDFHFWGSWMHQMTGEILAFRFTIYADVPAGVDQQYSHPGEELWIYETSQYNMWPIIGATEEGWFDPSTGQFLIGDHIEYWQYDVYIPEPLWFDQVEGTIYWLGIEAILADPVETFWGWKSSIEHFNDDATWRQHLVYCAAMDDGTGTVALPADCPYHAIDPMMIIDGLPAGTTIECDARLDAYSNVIRTPGGSLGGEIELFDAMLSMELTGTGDLTGFSRTIAVPVAVEMHHAPRANGAPVQEIPAVIYSLQGELFGDPDFCIFRTLAGEANGLPSLGSTTLTKLPDGTFHVDSFFDITYQIEFAGCPGSQLDGLAGTTTGATRLTTSGADDMIWIDLYEPPEFLQSMDLSFVITGGDEQPCDCFVGDANGDLALNVGDAVYIINYSFKGGPAPVPYPICSGDANCDCAVNVGDAVFLINYVFKGGPTPCDCPTWLSICGAPLRN